MDNHVDCLDEFLDNVKLQTFSINRRRRWQTYSTKAQNIYQNRFLEILTIIIRIVFPFDAIQVFEDLKRRENRSVPINRASDFDFSHVVESYSRADTWQQKRQVLSVIASKLPFKDVLTKIPEVTPHKYYSALNHAKTIGPALSIPDREVKRQRMDPDRLDAFLDFITLSHVVRDLPYGEKKMKMSDGTTHNMPNVVRCMGSADIIHQYKAYSQENNIVPLGIF